MKKDILKIIFLFFVGIGGGIFADQILWPYFIERPLFYQYRLEKSPVYVTERKEIYIQENLALTEAIEKVEKTVVGVKSSGPAGFFEGSGLVLTSDGLILTLNSLLPRGSNFAFLVEEEWPNWQILKRDYQKDLALVKVEKTGLSTTGFADPEELVLGQRIFLIGIVFEKGEPKKVVNQGILRSLTKDFIETNISEKSALAGAPIFNIEGRLVGLSTIKNGKVLVIPISKIKDFVGF